MPVAWTENTTTAGVKMGWASAAERGVTLTPLPA